MEAALENVSIKRALQWFEQEMRKCGLMRVSESREDGGSLKICKR